MQSRRARARGRRAELTIASGSIVIYAVASCYQVGAVESEKAICNQKCTARFLQLRPSTYTRATGADSEDLSLIGMAIAPTLDDFDICTLHTDLPIAVVLHMYLFRASYVALGEHLEI